MRPLNQKEVKGGDPEVVQFPGNGQILVSTNLRFNYIVILGLVDWLNYVLYMYLQQKNLLNLLYY